ncbi:MAG: ABC transporter ATP-binding protein, partial [Elusimicrobiales bacterium]|nr:ABC transporter ATP-binding protein [Elusimicrobiales bacterium]
MSDDNYILEIKNLSVQALIKDRHFNIINKINLSIPKEKTVAIVGESGSGKTITALSIIKLLEKNLKIKEGSIIFDSKDLTELSEEQIRGIRGKEISFVFQEPMTALNPVVDIKTQITEILTKHNLCDEETAVKKAKEILNELSIPSSKINLYPHNFSGGQRQRILLAMALISEPKLLIADEPTTALDVVTQMEILDTIEKFKKEKKLSVILITHNFSIVSNYSEYTYVMYLGEIMEAGKTENIVKNPRHPYTKALLNSVIKMDNKNRLKSIKGSTPSISQTPEGCR